MDKATAEQQNLFEAALVEAGCTFKISGKGNLNVIGGDRDAVADAATRIGAFVIHFESAESNGKIVGYDAKGFDFTGLDREGYDAKGFNYGGVNRDGQTAAAARAAKKATPPVLTSAPVLLRETAGATISKEGRRLYFAIPFGHQMAVAVKEAGGTWEAASKRWWIGAPGNMELVDVFDEMVEKDLVYAAQGAERKAAAESAAAAEQASLVWISIPFEAADVRKMAKLRFRGKYDPVSKRWGLLPDYALDVNTSLEKWRAAQDAEKAAQRTDAPIPLYMFNPVRALVEQAAWTVGQTIWSETEEAFVTLVTVKRTRRSGVEDDGGEDEAGHSYTATGRVATPEEITAFKAQHREGH